MVRLGITGGIGSGKTTVCTYFNFMKVPSYSADARAKYLMEHNEELKNSICELLGAGCFNEYQRLNRQYIADIVFNDTEKLEALNALVHPVVRTDYDLWCKEMEANGCTSCLMESALLVENGMYKNLDKLIVVTASMDKRIQRVMNRDDISEEQVKARINAQLPESEKLKVADFVINNDNRMEVLSQVISILSKI